MKKYKPAIIGTMLTLGVIAMSLAGVMSGGGDHVSRADCQLVLQGNPCQKAVGTDNNGECLYEALADGTKCPPEGGDSYCNPSCVCRDGKVDRVMRNCDDGNPCTKDSCGENTLHGNEISGGFYISTASMCIHEPAEGDIPCTDGEGLQRRCLGGACAGSRREYNRPGPPFGFGGLP